MNTRSPSRARRLSLTALVASAAVAAGVVAAIPAAAGPYDDKVVLSVGHVDAIDLQVVGGQPTIVVHDGTNPSAGAVDRAPGDVVLHAKNESAITVPASVPWLAPSGSTAWVLPQVQNASLLWPGWATERLPNGYFDAAPILRMTAASGPGAVEVWEAGSLGSLNRLFSSDETLSNANAVAMGSHTHVNWAFTAEGAYTLTFEVDAVRNGTPVTLGPVTYAFHVGDLPVDEEPVTTSLSISGMSGHVHTGDTVTLTAVQTPPTSEDHYHWFVKPAGATDFTVVNGQLTGTYAFTVTEAHDGAEILVRLYDHDHAVIAESPAVTVEIDDHDDEEPHDPPALSQTITATLDASAGSLVVSVDPDDRDVTMSPLALAADGSRWEATGELRPIRVIDTRAGRPGWAVSGQVGTFTASGASFGSEHLGWTPVITAQSSSQGAVAGAPLAPGDSPGSGLSISRPLASAPAGSGLGTADLGGGLDLHLPTSTEPGTYTATLTLTAI